MGRNQQVLQAGINTCPKKYSSFACASLDVILTFNVSRFHVFVDTRQNHVQLRKKHGSFYVNVNSEILNIENIKIELGKTFNQQFV